MLKIPALSIFRHRAYRRFWLGRVLSVFAIQIQTTAVGWQIYDSARIHGQGVQQAALLLGALGLAQFLPLLCLSLIGGQAADRFDRKVILLICLAAKAVIAAGLVLASGLPPDRLIPLIFAASVGAGAVNAFMPAANSALMPMLAPRDELSQAVAWGSLGFQASIVIGPALGGLLYGLGPAIPYSASLLLFAAAAALLLLTQTPSHQTSPETRTTRMILEGLRFVRDNKIVLGAISLDLVVVLLAGAVALLPAFARDILHAGPQQLGLLRSAMGAGAAVVAMALAMFPLRRNVGLWMFAATIVFGLATIGFGLSTSIWPSVIALAIAGGVDMISVYVRQNLILLATPDPMRGRVSAVSFVFISASNELGDFEAGLTARLFGPVLAVAIGGGAAVIAALSWMKLFPQLAKADGFEPAAD